ncbi:dihydropteroate synthase [Reichenbachiella sp. MALMAid0571]|uniref:dihydropteroate synthase n=1 Tax=Reichenbachiella sp. MALMAid0571 TaxID=3143939 RepID=UPI0032DECB00
MPKSSLNINGSLLDISSPVVMGIINLTADSFYDGGKIKNDQDLLGKAEKMLSEGAAILDVGAYSSRPGAVDIPVETEANNAIHGVESILKEFPEAVISIDTFRSEVAKQTIENGVSIVNDISAGGLDDKMFETVADLKVPYIMMHMRGNPQTMSKLTVYDNLISEIIDYFNARIKLLNAQGVSDVIIDPGFGFAKTLDQNFELLNKLELLNFLDKPILCGVSRKSMIWKSLGITADEALNGTTALNNTCLMKGASILRVHDVKEAMETIELYKLTISN